IVRPSIVFGPEDEFFNRFAAMASMAPALPLIGGGRTRFQPVYVDDVADAICEALVRPEARGKIYELGGPTVYSFRQLLELMLQETGQRRFLAPIPFAIAPAVGLVGEAMGFLPFLDAPITRDQVKLLKSDNVVGGTGDSAIGTIEDLGIEPTAVEAILPGYMVMYRKYGQFTEEAA
ncbi:MAG: NAD-dependent epimerase/dehydratase family protein, partial [Pseudomonadota bacterium]